MRNLLPADCPGIGLDCCMRDSMVDQASPLGNTAIPPLVFSQGQNELTIWGGWQTVEGYQAPGTNAVEIRCSRDRNTCSEAVATILHHTTGEDLEAKVFNYRVVRWEEAALGTVAEAAMAGCMDRRLVLSLVEKTAALNWYPPANCEGDTGPVVLVGDPLNHSGAYLPVDERSFWNACISPRKSHPRTWQMSHI